ncbi:MAG: branched-chain amino acid transaminase [Acidobacteria bacterium]|nr:branched-chain amino acid transaminase [Acidobacteriota bacterium]
MPDHSNLKIWHNGELINWNDATIHVMSHVVHYGSSVFEGMRCYQTGNDSAVFRLRDHVQRLLNSCKIYRMECPYAEDQLQDAVLETIRFNQLKSCYVRPIIFRGYGQFGVNPLGNPLETYIAVWEWGKYLGMEALEQGVDVCISSWNRFAPNTLPALAKAGGNYLNSQLVKMEAVANRYQEGVALDVHGYISEGSGENIFIVLNNVVHTPPLTASILPGITRDSVITIAKDLGYEVVETMLPREILYVADEVFFTGTAAEITPVRSVDHVAVGRGRRGPVTEQLQKEFFNYVEGKKQDRFGWLTPVYSSSDKPALKGN